MIVLFCKIVGIVLAVLLLVVVPLMFWPRAQYKKRHGRGWKEFTPPPLDN